MVACCAFRAGSSWHVWGGAYLPSVEGQSPGGIFPSLHHISALFRYLDYTTLSASYVVQPTSGGAAAAGACAHFHSILAHDLLHLLLSRSYCMNPVGFLLPVITSGLSLCSVPCCKGDVFTSDWLSLADKRALMKFLRFCLDLSVLWQEQQEVTGVA